MPLATQFDERLVLITVVHADHVIVKTDFRTICFTSKSCIEAN